MATFSPRKPVQSQELEEIMSRLQRLYNKILKSSGKRVENFDQDAEITVKIVTDLIYDI
jgi:hypothetical protein